jgi:hypothetical protein
MAYSKSKALLQFEESITELLMRCENCKKIALNYDVKVLAFQGAILLTCSALENYLKSLVDDWIFSLKNNNALMCHIPEKARKVIYIRSQGGLLKGYAIDGNEQDAASKIDFTGLAFQLSDGSKKIPSYIKGFHVYGNKKYPSVENIKKLFLTLEVGDILKLINIKYKRNYKLYLESFLGLRESLAHEYPPDVTYKDVTRQIKNVRTLTRKIDSIAHSKLVKVSGAAYWPS